MNYTYNTNSNKILKVDDVSGEESSFKDVSGNDYTYWQDGSLKSDNNKGISIIEYNYLKLPKRIVKGSTTILYQYDATGRKLKETIGSDITDYSANKIYKNNTLYQISHDEGRIVNGEYEYNITDHLGNLRVAFKDSLGIAKITQANAYGVWGEDLPTLSFRSTKPNQFTYQGKEFISETGQYDFGARMYDPIIGRWGIIDPKCELMRRWSPFCAFYNNPLRFIDPDGMQPGDLYDQKGNKIGTDNVNDGKVYVVTDKQTVKDLKNSGGTVANAGAVNSAVELPSALVRAEMGKAVDRSNSANDKRTDEFKGDDNEGGFHEEGGVYGTGANGEDKVVHAKPGSKTDPSVEGMASIAPSDPAIPSPIAADGSFHVHPSGSRSSGSNCIGCKGGSFNQSPTNPHDYNEARNYPKNSYVLGAGSGTVTIYNGNSTKPVATFPLATFRKTGN